jgi:Ca-activated chloride channel family protein
MRVSLIVSLIGLLAACDDEAPSGGAASSTKPADKVSFSLLAGSENKALADIFDRVAKQNGVDLKVDYKGSVDIGNALKSGSINADAVLPASSFWLQVADTKKLVKDPVSIARSPVILGVKKSVAEGLGWTAGNEVRVADILVSAEAGKLRFGMTSPLQSNSGAVAYFGILSANAGNPEVLQAANLDDRAVQEKTQRLLRSINRSTHSSGYLMDMMVADQGRLDAMFNYEANVIEADRQLVAAQKEPLVAVYPTDGMSIADFPLGCADHGDAKKTEFCHTLQTYLTSDAGKREIEQTGRRTGLGLAVSNPDAAVFNPDWWIQTNVAVAPITLPTPQVAEAALELYSTLRKPAFKVYVVDVSASMQSVDAGQTLSRETLMKAGMENVLVPDLARTYGFPPASGDVTVVIPFARTARPPLRVDGNNPDELRLLAQRVKDETLEGGTSLYTAMVAAMDLFVAHEAAHPKEDDPQNLRNYAKAIVLMTDGAPTEPSKVFDDWVAAHPDFAEGLPIFAVQFGEAQESVLTTVALGGKVFDGTKNLGDAIRQANGNN